MPAISQSLRTGCSIRFSTVSNERRKIVLNYVGKQLERERIEIWREFSICDEQGRWKTIGFFKPEKDENPEQPLRREIHGTTASLTPVAVLTNDNNFHGKEGYLVENILIRLKELTTLEAIVERRIRENALEKLSDNERRVLGIES